MKKMGIGYPQEIADYFIFNNINDLIQFRNLIEWNIPKRFYIQNMVYEFFWWN